MREIPATFFFPFCALDLFLELSGWGGDNDTKSLRVVEAGRTRSTRIAVAQMGREIGREGILRRRLRRGERQLIRTAFWLSFERYRRHWGPLAKREKGFFLQ